MPHQSTVMPPGIRIRPYAGPVDHPGIQAVRAAVRALEGQVWQPGPDLDGASVEHQASCLVAEVGRPGAAELVGYTWSDHWTEADGTWLHLLLGWVTPSWRRRGIGTALLARQEQQAAALAAHHLGPGPVVFGSNADPSQPDTKALLLRQGYRLAFTLVEMVREVAAPPAAPASLPVGLELRPVVDAHHWRIHHAIEECFRHNRHGHVPRTFDDYQREVRDTDLWCVAWDGDEVAGVAVNELRADGSALTSWLAVRAPWRRRGLGQALVLESLRRFAVRDVTTARLQTIAESPHRSLQLYERLGYQVVARQPRYRKPLEMSFRPGGARLG